MGWFSKNETPTQQFGTPSYNSGFGQQQSNMNQMNGMSQGGMGAMMMGQQAQNPMMQQMANDPITATARLLDFNDPVSDFIVSQNFAMLIELMGGVVTLAVKEFFSSVKFNQDTDTGQLSIDTASMPSSLATMSPENLQLTLQQVQNNVNMGIQQRMQQQQMFLMAHNPMGMQQNQPGFFGNLLGGILGNQMQQQGMIPTAGKVATGAALL